MIGFKEKLNVDNISSRYSEILSPGGEPIHTRAKCSQFVSMCYYSDKDIKFPKWSCVLDCCSEFPFVPPPN